MTFNFQPRPGFNPMLINWGGPDQPRTEHCSYCGDGLPRDDDGFVPLVFLNEGWVAEFCDHCQAAWWGVESFRDLPDDDEAA